MITTIAIVLLSITCILLAREVYKLQKRVKVLHNETNTRVSEYYIKTGKELSEDYSNIHTMIMELQLHLENNTQQKLDEIEKKIPITNDVLLKEVQQMRDDFLALRQNL
jgi:predicted Holliday junction resolvase-like endonuclease